MNAADIVKAYCDAHGLVLLKKKNGENDVSPIMPYLIMDCAYSEFSKEVCPLPLKHQAKKIKMIWLSTYHRFNQRLFSCLNQDQTDFAIDLMDGYEAAIGNQVMLMRVAIMDLVKVVAFKDQKIIASLLLCNIFSQVAQIVWGAVFRNDYGNEDKCPELAVLRNLSHRLSNSIVYFEDDINPNKSEKLQSAVDSFMNATTKWLKSYGHD